MAFIKSILVKPFSVLFGPTNQIRKKELNNEVIYKLLQLIDRDKIKNKFKIESKAILKLQEPYRSFALIEWILGINAYVIKNEDVNTQEGIDDSHTETFSKKVIRVIEDQPHELKRNIYFHFAFKSEEEQSLYLLRFLFEELVKSSKLSMGNFDSKLPDTLLEWLQEFPKDMHTPFPLNDRTYYSLDPKDLFRFLNTSINQYFDLITQKFGDSFTKKIFDQVFHKLHQNLGNLDGFSKVLDNISIELLDTQKLNLLSQFQTKRLLSKKIQEIESKNKALSIAQRTIETKNRQLSNLNQALESKVKAKTEHLQITLDELKKSCNDLDLFLYRTAHDLAGPVARIKGLINIFETDPEQAAFICEKIGKDANSLTKILTSIRSIFQLSASDLNIEEYSTHHLLENEILKDLRKEYPQTNIVCNSIKDHLDILIDLDLFSKAIKFLIENIIQINLSANTNNDILIFQQNIRQGSCYEVTIQEKTMNKGSLINYVPIKLDNETNIGLQAIVAKKLCDQMRIKILNSTETNAYKLILPVSLDLDLLENDLNANSLKTGKA